MVMGVMEEGHAVKVRGSIAGALDPFRKQSQRQERPAIVADGEGWWWWRWWWQGPDEESYSR